MKTGRPKNPRIRALENKVEKLELYINELLSKKSEEIDVKDLTCVAVGGTKKKSDGRYQLQVIKYNPVTKLAKVVEVLDAGDAYHRASFEMNKYIVRHLVFEEIE